MGKMTTVASAAGVKKVILMRYKILMSILLTLVLCSAFIGCYLGFQDPRIGTSYKYNDAGEPIRQKIAISPGDTLATAGGRPWLISKETFYFRYTDRNNNGYWDEETDKLVIHLPASDPQIWRFYDHEKRGDYIRKRYCRNCSEVQSPK